MQMGKVTRSILFTVMTTVVAFGLSTTGVAWANEEKSSTLDAIVVTGNPEGEDRFRSPASIWVIDEEQIKKANAASITDLLSTAATGYMSEWTPGQTSVSIRGGRTDGQGRDYKSWTMVLINGRRAGTANISKLSPNDVHRIEIMRGSASVRYGSQAIGGIINIIMKDGRNTDGGLIDTRIGSSGLIQTHAEYATTWGETGDVATYLGGAWGQKDDYEGGKKAETQSNTHWDRRGGSAAIDWQVNENNDLHLSFRSDGVYDVGFRGSGANLFANDDRLNQSADFVWDFDSEDLPVNWQLHGYMVYDEDNFQWGNPTTGTIQNDNVRRLYIMGLKFQPSFKLSDVNTLLVGIDFEHSKLSSFRNRVDNGGVVRHLQPLDVNQSEQVLAFYAEDTHHFFDDRLILRGGLRYTMGETSLEPTPNIIRQTLGSDTYKHLTWSVGANFEATNNISFRAGAATGFRAPTATELAGAISQMNRPNNITYGNPDVKPETNQQYEIGTFIRGDGWYVDAAVFHNEIVDRITTTPRAQVGTFQHNNYINSKDGYIIRGLELDSRLHLDEMADLGNWQLSFGLSASYHFDMQDEGRTKLGTHNTDNMSGIYKYQGVFYAQFGQDTTVSNPWSVRLTGSLYGPMYTWTEEDLRPEYLPYYEYIHKKPAFMAWDLAGEMQLSEQWAVYGGINNLLDKNQHPVYVAIDDGNPYLNNSNHEGDYGTSMPGREFYVGLKFSF